MVSGDAITVGVLTPHAVAGPDVEIPEMAGRHLRVRVAAIGDPAPGPASTAPSPVETLRGRATPKALDAAASTLFPDDIPGDVDVLALASTSTGYVLGPAAEAALLRRLSERWGVPACATSLATVSALRRHRVDRLSLVFPPWFGRAMCRLGVGYFTDQGFEVVEAHLAEVPDDPERIEPAALVEWAAGQVDDRAEAVVIGGNGFRAADAIAPLEQETGRLVLEANQVLLWSALASTRSPVAVRGFGSLLEPINTNESKEN